MKFLEATRNPSLDISRFLASVSVCIFHLYLIDFAWAELNAIAVDYFFILSGFVLQPGIFARNNSKNWILRRIIRIWTPLIPCVLLIYILIQLDILSTKNYPERNLLILVILALFLLQTFFPASVALNTPLWSLSAEILTNLIVLLVPRRKLSFVILAFTGGLISIFTGIVIHFNFPQLGIFHTGIALGRSITEFSIGILLKLTLNRTSMISTRVLFILMSIGAGILFPLFLLNKLFIVLGPIFVAPLLLLIVRVEIKSDSIVKRIAGKLGNTSYIIYLFHMPFAAIKEHSLVPASQGWSRNVLCETISLLLFFIFCYLFSNYIEVKIRRQLVGKFAHDSLAVTPKELKLNKK